MSESKILNQIEQDEIKDRLVSEHPANETNKFFNKEYYDPILDDPSNDSVAHQQGNPNELDHLEWGDVEDN